MKKFLLGGAGVLLLAVLALAYWLGTNPDRMIPSATGEARHFIGAPAQPQPVHVAGLAEHPFLAPQGVNSMHNDSYMSDAYPWPGPLGVNPQISSRQFNRMVGNCVAASLRSDGWLVSTCVTSFGVTLVARDAKTLDIVASKKITNWLPIGKQFSGGVYFHLDNRDRVLLASNQPAIELWTLDKTGESFSWQLEQRIDLSAALDSIQAGPHAVIDVMPDWRGHYWFITRDGLVGVADPQGKAIQIVKLDNERIDNALAINANGVYVASDHAMYQFAQARAEKPEIVWREAYDRGSAPKPGTMGHGTGTTPTLVGEDYVAITDNADGKINLLVYHQTRMTGKPQLLCQQPVFLADRGTSENSLTALGNSLIVENNLGYQGPFSNISAEPGLSRVDIHEQGCTVKWQNLAVSSPSAVPKASLANGLIYIYTRDDSNPEDMQAWYFTAVDYASGEVVFKILTGIGAGYNNHYGSITITPDGTAYIGVIQGVVKVKDGEPL